MRDRYHHGNLHQALVDAGVDAAREGGSSALALRELAKTVGVSPAAVYRHFPSLDHLVAEVAQRAREELARRMIAARDAIEPDGSADAAWRRFLATGSAYVRFGVSEPRLFEAAFAPCAAPPPRADAPGAWDVLTGALDDLVRTGGIAADRRPLAPIVAWSGVHGLTSIASSQVAPEGMTLDAATDAVLAGVRAALEAPSAAAPASGRFSTSRPDRSR
jgi:AcrR family transcriptional regulator